MQDVTIPKAGSNANSATRILLFIIAVHYHTARPQGKPVRREAPDGLPAHTPQAVIETCRAGLLTRLRSEAFPAQRPVASVPERFASAGHPDRKEAETYSSGNCRRFARRSLIRLPDGPPVGIEPRHVRKDSEYIGTKYPQKQKQPGRRADSTETGKSAATSIRSGIPRAARVKDRRNRSAQRYSSMYLTSRFGTGADDGRPLPRYSRKPPDVRSIPQALHPGNGSPHGKKRTFFRRAIGWESFPARRQAGTSSLQTAGNGQNGSDFASRPTGPLSTDGKQAPTRKQSTKNKRLWKKSNRPHSKKRTRPR